MKRVLFFITTSVILIVVFLVVQEDKKAIHVHNMRAWIPHYAENIRQFYDVNKRFPDSKIELSEYIFGSWSSNYTFTVIDQTQKVFAITVVENSIQTLQIQFQLSNTGVVQNVPAAGIQHTQHWQQ